MPLNGLEQSFESLYVCEVHNGLDDLSSTTCNIMQSVEMLQVALWNHGRVFYVGLIMMS